MSSSGVIVYRAVNMVNGHTYVGITGGTLHARRLTHASSARAGKPWPLSSAIRKYGLDMLRFTVLKECQDRGTACAEEKRLIALWRPKYNATVGGDGGSYWTGKKRDPDTMAKIFANRKVPYPRPASIEALKRCGAELAARRRRKVCCVETGERFPSCVEAAAAHGLKYMSVMSVASGKRTSVYGKTFRYLEN